jgi:hypothetical protein
MSWETDRAPEAVAPSVPPLVLMVVGFTLGLLAMAGTPFVYYWIVVPVFPLILAGVFALLGTKFTALRQVTEGLLAAALFGVVFVLVAFAGLGTLLSR